VVVSRLMTHHRVTQELRYLRIFSSGVLPLVLAQRPELPKWRIAVGLKRTCVSGLSTPGKSKGRMSESLRIEISEVQRYKGYLNR
jgi:hypothetical protein